MKTNLLLFFSSFILFTFIACNPQTEVEDQKFHDSSVQHDVFEDGVYCAQLEFLDLPSSADHTLSLELQILGGSLYGIYWSNEPEDYLILDEPVPITQKEFIFKMEEGQQIQVTIKEPGKCEFIE